MYVLIANAMMDSKKLFIIKKMTPGFKSIFTDEERAKVEKEARAFFKEHYGVSDVFLNTFMSEMYVNPEGNYRDQASGEIVRDGGFSCMVPKGKKLKGKYGGPDGVASDRTIILPFGYYLFNGKKIKYFGMCPMMTFNAFDHQYTPISCEIEMNGKRGTAEGIYIQTKLKNGLDHILIKNVLTF